MCSVVLSVIAPPSMMERSELVKNVALSCRDSYANSNGNYRKLLVLFLKFLSLDIGGAKKKANHQMEKTLLIHCFIAIVMQYKQCGPCLFIYQCLRG